MVATDSYTRSHSTIWGGVVVGVEGGGPWEASFAPNCAPDALLPVPAARPQPLATVRYRDVVDNGYLGEGLWRFTEVSEAPKGVGFEIENHYLKQSRTRFEEWLDRLPDDDDILEDEERTQLEKLGLWAETEFWLEDYPNADWSCDIIVRVERIKNRCSMSASVSGDVNGTVYGDVAYFNTFEKGAPLTTGSYADSEMHEMLQGWAGAMGDMAVLMGDLVDKEDLDRLKRNEQGFSVAQEDLARGQAELFSRGGDKFGLTLADSKFDAPTPTLEDGAMSDGVKEHLDVAGIAAGGGDIEGMLGSLLSAAVGGLGNMQKSGQLGTVAQGIDAMAGMFTLEASAPGHYVAAPGGAMINLPLSSLVVAPGAIDDVGRIPFIYSKKDGVGHANLNIFPVNENFFFGQVVGELYTEGTYSNLGRKGKITVVANFTALRGANACH